MLDPAGVMERKSGRLRRRVYLSKVTVAMIIKMDVYIF